MDDQAGEDDGYSDDDLDALPDHDFHELQENAIRLTQQPRDRHVSLSNLKSPRAHGIAGGLGRLSVGGKDSYNGLPEEPHQASSDYGDFDDEMLEGEIFDAAEQPALVSRHDNRVIGHITSENTQREQWRQQRYGVPTHLAYQGPHQTLRQKQEDQSVSNANSGLTNNRNKSTEESGGYQGQKGLVTGAPSHVPTDVDALQVQVQKLLYEREQLQQAIKNANDSANRKAGEIAIVRANISKVEKEYENRTEALQKMHTEEALKHKMEVEKARGELQKIATEKDFLENDLAEGTKQVRNLQKVIQKRGDKTSEAKAPGKENALATPKKGKNLSFADGFVEEDVQPLSPSRLALRSKADTPKTGAKRKRKATEGSPIQSLELAQPILSDAFPEASENVVKAMPTAFTCSSSHQDEKYQFMQKLLNHRISHDTERSFEALAKYRLPSQPDKALSTILLDKMSLLGMQPDVRNLPSSIALLVISIWSQCIEENYYQPIHLLLDFTKYILISDPLKTAPELINSLMSLVQETADILIIPRCQKKPPRKDRAQILSTECISILQLMALDCSIEKEEIIRFWRTMRFDFVMMLLSFIHPLEELHMTISILRTSVLDNSFAMIIPPGDGKQDVTEARVIDNLSRLLVEAPRPTMGEDILDSVELSELRLAVLDLLEAMCDTDYGASALAKHRLVIGRLVRVMNDELDRAYDYQYGHELHIALVNVSTRLLFFLTTNYSQLIDMQARLSVIPGGEKKFLIALTRLAFSEGGFFEKGIEDDVVDCAHQMLEPRVNPEEAEQLLDAFSSAPGTKTSSRAGKDSA